MLRHSICIGMLTLLHAVSSNAQVTIEGIITDKTDRQLLPGAQVQLAASDKPVIADSNGYYKIEAVPPGRYQLIISRIGYFKTIQNVDIEKANTVLNIQLIRNVLDLAAVTVKADKNRMASVMAAMDMRLQPIRSAQDLLRTVPGLFIAQHAGGGKAEEILLRGTNNDHGTDFGIFMDGIPINLPNHAHGQGYADMHFIIPEVIGNASYYKGPYEAGLGDFTNTGAAVYRSVYRPAHSFLKMEGGQFDTWRVAGLLATPQSFHFLNKHAPENAYIAAEYTYTNGYVDNPLQYKRLNILGRYNISLNSRNELSLIASIFNSSWNASGQIPERAVNEKLIGRYGSIDSTGGGNTTRANVNASLTTRINDRTELQNQLYYSRYDFRFYSNPTYFMIDVVNGDGIKQYEKRDLLGYNGSLRHRFSTGNVQWSTLAGVTARVDLIDYGRDHVKYREFLNNEALATARVMNYSVYVSETLKWQKHWTINVGVRNDLFLFHNNDVVDGENTGNATIYRFSPKLNVFYDLSDHITLVAKSGMGFHSNYSNIAIRSNGSNAVPRSYGADLGTHIKISNKAYLTATAWYLESGAEYRYNADDGSYEDIGPSVRTGVELSVRYNIWRNLWADVNLDAAKPRLKDAPDSANRIPFAPQFTSTGGLSYQAAKGFSGSLRYRYMGNRAAIEDNSSKAQSYTLFDMVVQYSFKNWDLGLSAENLLNVKWREGQFYDESQLKGETAPVMDFHYTPGTPFLLKGSVTFRF